MMNDIATKICESGCEDWVQQSILVYHFKIALSSIKVYHLHRVALSNWQRSGRVRGEWGASTPSPAQACCIGLSSDPCPSWGTSCCWRNLASSLGFIDSHMNASFRGAAKVAMRSSEGNSGGNWILDQPVWSLFSLGETAYHNYDR